MSVHRMSGTDKNGKKYSWIWGDVGFLFGMYEVIETKENLLGFQTCAYLAEFPNTEDECRNLMYTDNQVYNWVENNQTQVRMLYGFRITKIKNKL